MRSASDAPIRPVPPGTRSARSAAPSARHPRPTDPASRRPGRRPRPQRPLTKPRPEPAFHRASPAEISVKSLRTIPQTGSSERMMRVVNMKAFSARQTPLRQEKAAETRQKNRDYPEIPLGFPHTPSGHTSPNRAGELPQGRRRAAGPLKSLREGVPRCVGGLRRASESFAAPPHVGI